MEAISRRTDSGIPITADYIPAGRKNRPGGRSPCTYITLHETGNFNRGADAAAHAAYLKSDAAVSAWVSWHYTVDGKAIVQHLPDTETAYHAGDGAKGPGNCTSIGIEICVDEGGDFAAAQANAAALVRLLMAEHGIPLDHVVQHHHWNGKDCPRTIRHTPGAWEAFLDACRGAPQPEAAPWYQAAAEWAKARGLSDGTRPEAPCTRAEVWQMLYNQSKGGA